MRAILEVRSIDCPHCGKDTLANIKFAGDSSPYVEEDQKEVEACDHCKKEFSVRVKFSVGIDE